MKVLWFSNTPANSDEYFNRQLAGTGGWLKSLDKCLQEEVNLHIAFYHPKKIPKFNYKKTTYYPIYKPHHRKIRERILGTIINDENLRVYLDIINEVQPDIIHIHGTENSFACLLGEIEIPVVISLQGNITVILHKYCSGIEEKYLDIKNRRLFRLKSMLFPYSFRRSWEKFKKMQLREEKSLENCRYVIGRTDWDRRVTRLMAPRSIYFHCDEILRDRFYEVEWKPRGTKKFIIHTTSGNSFYKGLETVCLALNELNKNGFECEWQVAGISIDDLIVKVVKRKIKEKFPLKNLTFLGRVNGDLLIEKMLESDLFVMPSHIENSSNSLCEAMIIGMPCIASFAGGTGSLLEDKKDGLLVQDGDPWALAGAIGEIYDDYEMGIAMARNARIKALGRHNKEKVVFDMMNIYKEILGMFK